jgi:SSS family solute:Na+ symporter
VSVSPPEGNEALALLDWLIILAYLGTVFGLAAWVFLRRKDTPDDYFLADRNLPWFIVGASIFASNIGSEHIVGLAGSGATSGVAMAHYELHAWCLVILAWVFVTFFMRTLGSTRCPSSWRGASRRVPGGCSLSSLW